MRVPVLPNPEILPQNDLIESSDLESSEIESFPEGPIESLARLAASTAASPLAKGRARSRCLLPDAVRRGDGIGPVVALDEYAGKLLVLTLRITDVMERTGLSVSVWGSADQENWGPTPLVTFRQRQYCGVYSVLLNLARNIDARYVRVQWNTTKWGKGERTPLFGFEVFVEESGARISTTAVA